MAPKAQPPTTRPQSRVFKHPSGLTAEVVGGIDVYCTIGRMFPANSSPIDGGTLAAAAPGRGVPGYPLASAVFVVDRFRPPPVGCRDGGKSRAGVLAVHKYQRKLLLLTSSETEVAQAPQLVRCKHIEVAAACRHKWWGTDGENTTTVAAWGHGGQTYRD